MFAILGTIHNRDFYSNPMLLTQVCSMDHTLRNTVLVEIWRILYPRDWRRKWQPTPVFLPGESQGQKSLVGCRLGGRTELDTTEALSSSSSSIHKRGSPCVCVFFSGEESACDAEDAGDPGSIPGLERPPRGGHGHPLQYSCLENPMDSTAYPWQATVHRISQSQAN